MKTLVIYLSEDKKVKKLLSPTEKFMEGDPSYGDYQSLARAICFDAGDSYYGFSLIGED